MAELIFKYKGRIGNSTELDAIGSPSLKHLGILVRDLKAATGEFSKIFGIDSWETFEFTPPADTVTVGEPFKVKVANAYLLGLLFHIFEPAENIDTFADSHPVWGKWLQRSFGGIQHVCVSVNKWDRMVYRIIENGGRVYKSYVTCEGKRIAHIEGEIGNMAVAIEERTPQWVRENTEIGVSNRKGKVGSSKELDAMANPSLQHLGVMVRDSHTFIRYASKVWGVDAWETLEYRVPQEEMIVGRAFRCGMINGNVLGLLLHGAERIDDVDTYPIPEWLEWERTRGEGIYHPCISVDNWERVVDTIKSRGGQLFASSAYEGRRWAHFLCPVNYFDIEIEERPKT